MTHLLYLATASGLLVCDRHDADWQVRHAALADGRVTCVAAQSDIILAGSRDGIMRSTDQGATWHDASAGLAIPYVRCLAFHPTISGLAFAGTEPAGIFVSEDGGTRWRACPEVAELRDAHGWFLPYSPRAGCIRGFSCHGDRIYAAAEVGGALCSHDRGATWQLCAGSTGSPDLAGPPEPFIYPDVHEIAVHPSSLDLVFAPTGGGFYRSRDGGERWERIYDCYVRAVWLDPADPTHIVFGPADNVDRRGRIEATRDGGRTWQLQSDGLDVPWPRHMVEHFTQVGDQLFAVLSNGRLLAAPLATLQWQTVVPEVTDVAAVASSHP